MKNIKIFYKISLLSIIILYILILFLFNFDSTNKVGQRLEVTAIFVALFTSIMALAIGDKLKDKISFDLKVFGNKYKGAEEYKLKALSDSIKKDYEKYEDSFWSYRVNFKITNTTKTVLQKPTITIKVPAQVKHPSQNKKASEIRSNMFNSSTSLQILEYGDTVILSNSNLPFLHPNESIKLWLRMTLDINDEKHMNIHVALDSKNVEGCIHTIKMSPKKIINTNE